MLRNTLFNEKLLTHLKHWACKSARKRFIMLSFVTIMVIGTFAFASNMFFLTARATYVGGDITQNTVWTLVDSPFVISQNVTVHQGVTLTIEPGVQVKFGRDFSLIVNGRLIANGIQNSMINFTSNKYQPSAGDWGTIEFDGMQQSLLAYCSIEYAVTGITALHCDVSVTNSAISNDAQYGISISNSTAQIQADEIANNAVSGIYISGNNQVTIQNNTIRSNADGILLDGSTSAGVSISKNIVLSNTQSGIHLNAGAYTNLIILYNNVSANDDGFLISGNASTHITNNSISYNNVGFLYTAGQDHQAHWNNITNNVMGMDVSASGTGMVVNATYNYWGDPSGPYHVSLNPAGKGNPVGGNGVNLDFIFFCTAPIGYVDHPPTAWLRADKKVVSLNQLVTFFATNSSNDRHRPVDEYFFSFGDGQNSGWTTLSVFVHNYTSVGTYDATVKVMDDFGVISNNLANSTITCEKLPPLTVSLIPSSLSVSSSGQVPVAVKVTNGTSPVSNAGVILFSILGGSFAPLSGVTNSSGYFATMFYAPSVTAVTNIRMVASASETGFADGSDYEYLMVQPPLMVNITPNSERIYSGATTNVAISVAYSGVPVSAANVTVSSNSTGRFGQTIGVTNANGTCTFVFTAPQTSTQLEINIVATATKSGYLDGQGQALLTIQPKVFLVQVMPSPAVINSEMSSNITVKVVYAASPISNATVILSSDKGGSFSSTNRTTGANGECVFTFTSPQVITPTNITITAIATKIGYAQAANHTIIAVNLGTLSVQVSASPVAVNSGATSQVTVYVTYNGQPVANVAVNVSSGEGTFAATTGTTDNNGTCVFTFTAPDTSTEFSLAIMAKATKNGYLDGQGQISITVSPASSSLLSLPVIIAIIAVILVIVIVLILIKLKVIVISQKGEVS